jgi:hypothetical protein
LNEKEIRDYNDIPEKEIRDDKWSEPFKVGDVVPILGKKMRIVKVKKLRGEIVLRVVER